MYLTARSELTFEPEHFQAVKPAANALTADNLWQRVERFNKNDRGLQMKMVSVFQSNVHVVVGTL